MAAVSLTGRAERDVVAGTVLGLDEAGRGSVLGPLVVGGFLLPEADLDRVVRAGACDSKAIGADERVAVYRRLGKIGKRLSIVIPPSEIDGAVAVGQLNHLEARAFARLIARHRPAVAYADACDPVAARFGRTVGRLCGTRTDVRALHHADRDLPIVGAASIVAKVLRDRAVERLARTLGEEIGSGYPSDPVTIACLRRTLGSGAPVPGWVRRSWSTLTRVKPPAPVATLDQFSDAA